jgi:transposase-like protein
MAEGRRMTAADAVDKLMASEHADVIRESVAVMVGELIEAEVAALVGAELGERAPERRTAQRNGYRERGWDTRVGELELAIPKLRSGPAYFPSFLEPRRRAEQALVAVVQEAYVNGVSTRKVDRVVEQLGVRMSKDQVSRLCRRLDEQVTAFRERPLEGAYPYLWLDAKQEKVRDGGHVVSKALVIAYGVHESGRREVIGLDVGEIESEAFWREFLRSLRRRGLDGVRLCISDAHEGLKHAIARVLGCPWQRCTVHFVRDMHQHCQAEPARARLGRAARGLQHRRLRRRARARQRRHRAAHAGRAEGRRAARRGRGGPAGLLPLPGRALEQAALDEPAGACQPRDRPPLRRRRHLPQRRVADPARRDAPDRAKRRMARRPTLPLPRIPGRPEAPANGTLRPHRPRPGSLSPRRRQQHQQSGGPYRPRCLRALEGSRRATPQIAT